MVPIFRTGPRLPLGEPGYKVQGSLREAPNGGRVRPRKELS